MGDVALDAVGVDDAAVGKHDPLLSREEGNLRVEDALLDRLVVADVAADDLDGHFFVDLLVHRLVAAASQHPHQRTAAAQTHAPRRDHHRIERQV